jgi:ribosomal protein L30E
LKIALEILLKVLKAKKIVKISKTPAKIKKRIANQCARPSGYSLIALNAIVNEIGDIINKNIKMANLISAFPRRFTSVLIS